MHSKIDADQPGIIWNVFIYWAMLKETLKLSILYISLEITNLKLQPHLPGANELWWVIW